MRTSASDPIRVDFLPREACPVPGRIGLTFAPGKKDRPGGWDRSVEADVARLADHYETSLLVSLIEDAELELLHIQDLYGVTERRGVRVRRLPIRDADVPRSPEEVIAVVRLVLTVASAGDTVVIHCRGGLGRAGTLASCCLVALGLDAGEAIGIVRGARPGAVETRGQESFVDDFTRAWGPALSTVLPHLG